MARDAEARKPRSDDAPALGAAAYVLLYAAYLGALLLVYQPALQGPFVSDDIHYVATNPYVHELSAENVWTILQPYGAATIAVVNYSPVQLLMHGMAWQAFGADVLGHHVLNLLFHAGGSLLLLPLLLSCGVPCVLAALGSVFFLLHPANVEAVAWVSQLKTNASMVFALSALLAHPKRPALGLVLYALALLTKPNAAVALPVAFWLEYARTGRVRAPWLAAWLVLFTSFAVVEFTAHQRSGAAEATLHETPLALLRTMAALATRYVALGVSGVGTSAFHEPEPALDWLHPWWLASLPVLGLLGWRLFVTLRGRRPEAAFWLFALVSFGPVSQLFPFLYPFADRYLYYMLPGLIGGLLLFGLELAERLSPERRMQVARGAVAAIALGCVAFAWSSHDRAKIWRGSAFILVDAATNYPDGVSARLLRAKRAAQAQDATEAVAELRGAVERGYNRFEQLVQDPAWDPIRSSDGFQAVLRDTAQSWIDASQSWEDPTQIELRRVASAHAVRGEHAEAVELLRRALARGGPIDDGVRADLRALGVRD